jgi:predicted dehydrogenase
MGQHEDVAQARIEFTNGCVAQLSASRVSYRARREMQIWSPHAQVEIDFATRRTTAVEPVDTLVDFDFNERDLSAEQKQHLQKHLFAELLPAREQEAPAQNALVEEQRDFIESICTGRAPRVGGEQGRAVVAAVEQVLASIAEHRWDDFSLPAVGPLRIFAAPEPNILRGPHWDRPPHDQPAPRRRKEAG